MIGDWNVSFIYSSFIYPTFIDIIRSINLYNEIKIKMCKNEFAFLKYDSHSYEHFKQFNHFKQFTHIDSDDQYKE